MTMSEWAKETVVHDMTQCLGGVYSLRCKLTLLFASIL